MILRYILFTFLILLGNIAFGQDSFHRIFEINEQGDTLLHHLASTTNDRGQFISVLGRQIDGEYISLIFTKQDDKGNFESKLSYTFGEGDEVTDVIGVDLIIHEEIKDSIFFAATLILNSEPQPIVGKLHSTQFSGFGTVQVTDLDFSGGTILGTPSGLGDVTSYHDSTYIYSVSDSIVVLSRMEKDHQSRWSQRFEFTNTDGDPFSAEGYDTDISSTDSTIYSMGLLHTFELYQLVVDSLSIEQMAKKYTLVDIDPTPTEFITIGEDDAVMTGYYEGNGGNTVSYVIMTDTIGDVLWAKNVTIEGSSTEIYNVTQSSMTGDIVIGGKFFPEPDSTQLFTAALDLLGNVKWISSYGPRPVDADLKYTSLNPTPTGGVILAANGFVEAGGAGITFIKQTADGNTTCSDTLMPTQFTDLSVITDTLFVNRKDGVMYGDSIAHMDTTYSKLIEPQLNLDPRAKQFCPNDSIMELLTASVTNVDTANISYEWSTGALTDTARVFEEGDYMVTVTISENSCYMMCDTLKLTRSSLPTVEILPDFGTVCETGIVTLEASVTPGSPPYSYLWGAGETSQFIDVTDEGMYSVKIYDSCGDSVETTYNLIIELGDFTLRPIKTCIEENLIQLTADVIGGGFSYQWNDSSMSNTESIIVQQELATYSVTVTDECGIQKIETFELGLGNAELIMPIESNCEGIEVGEEALYQVRYEVSGVESMTLEQEGTGFNKPGILDNGVVTFSDVGFGSYQVNINDECQDLELNLAPCGQCLRYATVFFPGAATTAMTTDSLDITFGPVFVCGDQENIDNVIREYEFKIFNRWGQEVFSSNDPKAKWDGRWNDELVQSEVYIYYARYFQDLDENGENDSEEPTLDKGDITVVR